MNSSLVILTLGLVVALLVTATLHFVLRTPSRTRVTKELCRMGREQLMTQLVDARGELVFCMAILRTCCALALTLAVVRMAATSGIDSVVLQYLAAFVASVGLVLVFGVALPSAWSKYAGESLLAATLPFLLMLRTVFYPLVYVHDLLDAFVRRLAGVPPEDDATDAVRHERELLDAVSEGEMKGAVDEEEKEMIESIMDLRDSDVAEIMTPRTEIEAVEKGASLAEIKNLIRTIGHSRIPIYDETIDRVVGIVHAKDLLQIDGGENFVATDVMRPPLFVPESKNVRDLLHEFQAEKVHLAIVLDEYGGTAGLVTLEDILEELVGEIEDEYDAEEPAPMTRIDNDTVDIDARMRVDELNEQLDIQLPEHDDYETIGGFVFSTIGHIPTVGERCAHENVEIQVIDAEPRRINRLRLHVNRNERTDQATE